MSSEDEPALDSTPRTAAPPTQSVHESDLRAKSDAQYQSPSGKSTKFGPYELLREIGRGGMGTVWLATQEQPIKRTVALKVIRSEFAVGEMLVRFEAERQALALMNHPNVAQILDAGATPEGQPYFAMEYVDGKPLNEYCDENRLSVQERLRLFLDVCAGVQHAHQKGIIHRDLKPSNILVAMEQGVAVVKVIDFGLAKAIQGTDRLTEQSLFTQIGQVLGTYQYMSPEQANLNELDIDTRTDVYALGVILYELLTGCTPLENSTLKGMIGIDILRMIRDYEPMKPSSRLSTASTKDASSVTALRQTDTRRLKQILLGDLDWIAMRALEKDRARRYPSVTSFADDVQRYINNEPVSARPPSVAYRLRKYARKHRGWVASVVAISAVLFVATIVSGYSAFSYKHQEEIARESLATAAQRLQEMEDANYVMGRLFKSLDAQAAKDAGLTIDSVLSDRLVKLNEEIGKRKQGNPNVKATTLHGLAEILLSLQPSSSLIPFELALEIRRSQLGANHEATIDSQVGLARAALLTGDRLRALELSSHAFERIDTPIFGNTLRIKILSIYLQTLSELGRSNEVLEIGKASQSVIIKAIDLVNISDLAYLLNTLLLIFDNGGGDYSDQLFARLIARAQTQELLNTADPSDARVGLLNYLNVLASHHLRLGQPSEALAKLDEANELLNEEGWTHMPIGVSIGLNTAQCFLQMEKLDKGILQYQQLISVIEKDPVNLGSELIPAKNNLAQAYVAANRPGDAEKIFSELISSMEQQNATTHPYYLRTLNNWIRARLKSSEPETVLDIVDLAIKIRKDQLGETHAETLKTLRWKGRILRDLKQIEQSITVFIEVMQFDSEAPELVDIGIETLETFLVDPNFNFDRDRLQLIFRQIENHSERLNGTHKKRIYESAESLEGRGLPEFASQLKRFADTLAD